MRHTAFVSVLLLIVVGSLLRAEGGPEPIGGKALVRLYFKAYARGNSANVDALAVTEARYAKLVAAGMPKKLLCYTVMDRDSIGSPAPQWGNPPQSEKPERFYVIANDIDGSTRRFIVNTDGSKVTKVRLLPQKKLMPGAKGRLLTRSERLAIIKTLEPALRPPKESFYVDFGDSEYYKSYTSVLPSWEEMEGVGAVTYMRKTNGRWKVLLETQNYTSQKQLDKLGVPRDVQAEIWGEDVEKP